MFSSDICYVLQFYREVLAEPISHNNSLIILDHPCIFLDFFFAMFCILFVYSCIFHQLLICDAALLLFRWDIRQGLPESLQQETSIKHNKQRMARIVLYRLIISEQNVKLDLARLMSKLTPLPCRSLAQLLPKTTL